MTDRYFQIEKGETFARAVLNYRGTAADGMLAWLDAKAMKYWWRAESVIIEPVPEGSFYINWYDKNDEAEYAIYGVIRNVDTEKNIIEIGKLLYISPYGKMSNLELKIVFTQIAEETVQMELVHTHNYKGQLLNLYNAAVESSWPPTFALLKKFLEEKECDNSPSFC